MFGSFKMCIRDSSKSNNQEQVLKDEKTLSFEYYKDKALDTTIFPGVVAAWRPFQLSLIHISA